MDKKKIFAVTSSAVILGMAVYFSGNSIIRAANIDAEMLYMSHCKTCHGTDGKPTDLGEGLGARDFTDPQWQTKITDEQIIKQITEGSAGQMFPFKDKLSEEEIKALVPIVRGFGKKE
ncbi:MAG: c-type cytochrome [wastewater metagenome]|nr:c-type cytochrome [Candidatus Loosdrechtia aerotolerans]